MTIRLTNTCNEGCTHCMQNSIPKENHMSMETLEKTVDFINLFKNNKTVNVSGGEPTEYPKFIEMMEYVAKNITGNKIITLLSNGSFLLDNKLRKDILMLLYKNKKILVQITSIKGIYPNYDLIKDNFHKTMSVKTPVISKLKKRIVFVNKFGLGILDIGRATKNKDSIEKTTFFRTPKASKCFNLYNVLGNLDFNLVDAVNTVKAQSASSLCIPMIKENGDVVFGEYDACSKVLNVHDDIDKNTKLSDIEGPCGSCVVSKSQEVLMNNFLLKFYPNMLKNKRTQE